MGVEMFPDTLCLNGKPHKIEALLKTDSFISEFLREWYDDKDYITVQTSGSTGTPKAIQLKKIFIADSAKRTLSYFNLQKNDRVLLCLPICYIAGKLMVVRALLGKLDLHVLPPNDDFSGFSELPSGYFHFVALVINQVAKLLENPQYFNCIETLLIGGSSLPIIIENALNSISTSCYMGYGMTETATHIALRTINGNHASEYYRCLNGISVLSNDDCLVIKLPNEILLRTNDITELRDDKTFKILGRADNVIISGGIKFIPEVIEGKISPYIKENFIISSQTDAKLGEKITLVIEGDEEEEIKKHVSAVCRQYLTRYECPKSIVFKPFFPCTESNKVIRHQVRIN